MYQKINKTPCDRLRPWYLRVREEAERQHENAERGIVMAEVITRDNAARELRDYCIDAVFSLDSQDSTDEEKEREVEKLMGACLRVLDEFQEPK